MVRVVFLQHALPLPGFLLLFSDIAHHISITNQSAPLDLPILNVLPLVAIMPRMWLYLLGNVLSQSVAYAINIANS